MNNKRGFTLIELIIVLSVTSVIMYGMFFVPMDLIKRHSDYREFSDRTNDVVILRNAIASDINNETLKQVDDSTILIGNSEYSFENVVSRNSVSITSNPYEFELDGDNLRIFSDEVDLEYKVNSSFSRGEHNE